MAGRRAAEVNYSSAQGAAMRGYTGLMLAVLVSGTGCSYGVGAVGGGQLHGSGNAVHLNVTNRSGGPAEIYASGSGTEYRIGTVQPGLPGRFVVRPGIMVNGAVEFTARSDGGRVVRSGPMLLRPGNVVDFELEGSATTSRATVRAWVDEGR